MKLVLARALKGVFLVVVAVVLLSFVRSSEGEGGLEMAASLVGIFAVVVGPLQLGRAVLGFLRGDHRGGMRGDE